jgi:hypothetical protein
MDMTTATHILLPDVTSRTVIENTLKARVHSLEWFERTTGIYLEYKQDVRATKTRARQFISYAPLPQLPRQRD